MDFLIEDVRALSEQYLHNEKLSKCDECKAFFLWLAMPFSNVNSKVNFDYLVRKLSNCGGLLYIELKTV